MINKRIKQLRKYFDYSQKEFGKVMGVSRRNVQRWEYEESGIAEYYLKLLE